MKKWCEKWLKVDIKDYEKTLIQLGFLIFILEMFVVIPINSRIKLSDTLDPYQKILYLSIGRCIIAFLAGICATVSAYWLKSDKIKSDKIKSDNIAFDNIPATGVETTWVDKK
ncbi:MAG: hypothetical protein GX061_03225 [Eubacteriaceae bacterium]|nr:hypothetical protein [Eubacteriaceae bacterium]